MSEQFLHSSNVVAILEQMGRERMPQGIFCNAAAVAEPGRWVLFQAMSMDQIAVILKRFEAPDEVRVLQKGRFELVHLGSMTIGRATYEPGWKWSEHVGPGIGATRCCVEHVGLVLSGIATAAFDNGNIFELRSGDLFYIPPAPHDSWVVGEQPYISLHFLGADRYAARSA